MQTALVRGMPMYKYLLVVFVLYAIQTAAVECDDGLVKNYFYKLYEKASETSTMLVEHKGRELLSTALQNSATDSETDTLLICTGELVLLLRAEEGWSSIFPEDEQTRIDRLYEEIGRIFNEYNAKLNKQVVSAQITKHFTHSHQAWSDFRPGSVLRWSKSKDQITDFVQRVFETYWRDRGRSFPAAFLPNGRDKDEELISKVKSEWFSYIPTATEDFLEIWEEFHGKIERYQSEIDEKRIWVFNGQVIDRDSPNFRKFIELRQLRNTYIPQPRPVLKPRRVDFATFDEYDEASVAYEKAREVYDEEEEERKASYQSLYDELEQVFPYVRDDKVVYSIEYEVDKSGSNRSVRIRKVDEESVLDQDKE